MRIPVFPNWYPYNDMLFDRRLRVGRFGVKTRSYNWDYRGPVLFYNSGRTAWHCVNIYGYKRGPEHHGVIIGSGELAMVRPLDLMEEAQMAINFNNLKIGPRKYWRDLPFATVRPLPFGYFFPNQSLKRFEIPIQFKWPAGPVRPIFIEVSRYPRIHTQLLSARS